MAREEKAYARVIEKVKKMILSGELKPGEKLPPEREFAEELEVSRNSVREAIRIMDMMGIVSSQQGSGNYVTCEFQKSITETMAMMFAMDQVNDKQISLSGSACIYTGSGSCEGGGSCKDGRVLRRI